MMTRIAVTGANGFVGKSLLKRLAKDGHEIIPLVRTEHGLANEIVTGDLAAMEGVSLPPIDCFVHLVARTHILTENTSNPTAEYKRINVDGTKTALSLAKEAGARHFIYLSSVKALGEETRENSPFNEQSIPQPEDDYGRTKLEAEQLVSHFCEDNEIAWTVIRPPLVYGPGVRANFALLIRLVTKGLPMPFGSCNNARSLVYVENLSDFINFCIDSSHAHNRSLLISDGTDLSTAMLIQMIGKSAEKRVFLLPLPTRIIRYLFNFIGKGATYRKIFGNLQLDIASSNEMGWEAPYSMETGIKDTVMADRCR